VSPAISDEALQKADEAVKLFWDYILLLADGRRQSPGDDVISALVMAESEEGKLSQAEFVGIVHTLIAGAVNTAQGMLSSGALAFLQCPEERMKLVADEGLAAPATEEVLRFQAPIQIAFQRIAMENTILGNQRIARGEVVNVMIGAANHDPAAFPPDPERFSIDRNNQRHLTFGNGIHFCVGATVARAEGEITFPRLVARLSNLELVDAVPDWREGYVIRSHETLYVRQSSCRAAGT
jgi:cytochrome P450